MKIFTRLWGNPVVGNSGKVEVETSDDGVRFAFCCADRVISPAFAREIAQALINGADAAEDKP